MLWLAIPILFAAGCAAYDKKKNECDREGQCAKTIQNNGDPRFAVTEGNIENNADFEFKVKLGDLISFTTVENVCSLWKPEYQFPSPSGENVTSYGSAIRDLFPLLNGKELFVQCDHKEEDSEKNIDGFLDIEKGTIIGVSPKQIKEMLQDKFPNSQSIELSPSYVQINPNSKEVLTQFKFNATEGGQKIGLLKIDLADPRNLEILNTIDNPTTGSPLAWDGKDLQENTLVYNISKEIPFEKFSLEFPAYALLVDLGETPLKPKVFPLPEKPPYEKDAKTIEGNFFLSDLEAKGYLSSSFSLPSISQEKLLILHQPFLGFDTVNVAPELKDKVPSQWGRATLTSINLKDKSTRDFPLQLYATFDVKEIPEKKQIVIVGFTEPEIKIINYTDGTQSKQIIAFPTLQLIDSENGATLQTLKLKSTKEEVGRLSVRFSEDGRKCFLLYTFQTYVTEYVEGQFFRKPTLTLNYLELTETAFPYRVQGNNSFEYEGDERYSSRSSSIFTGVNRDLIFYRQPPKHDENSNPTRGFRIPPPAGNPAECYQIPFPLIPFYSCELELGAATVFQTKDGSLRGVLGQKDRILIFPFL